MTIPLPVVGEPDAGDEEEAEKHGQQDSYAAEQAHALQQLVGGKEKRSEADGGGHAAKANGLAHSVPHLGEVAVVASQ